jgi:hypothetical protein
MKEIRNENKTSKLVFDPRVTRKLLKMNGELKYCPYCGKALVEKCECHKNLIVDVKPLRDGNGETIAVFANSEAFQKDFTEIMDELKAKADAKKEPAQPEMDID